MLKEVMIRLSQLSGIVSQCKSMISGARVLQVVLEDVKSRHVALKSARSKSALQFHSIPFDSTAYRKLFLL